MRASSCKHREALDMESLGKHIEGGQGVEAIPPLQQEPQVTCERPGVAGDVDDARRPALGELGGNVAIAVSLTGEAILPGGVWRVRGWQR